MKKAILIAVLLLFILMISSATFTIYDESFYKTEFTKYNVYSSFHEQNADKLNIEVLSYLKQGKGNLSFFNEKERSHLADVKKVMQYLSIINYTLISLLIISVGCLYWTRRKKIVKEAGMGMVIGGALTLLISFIFWLMVKLDFLYSFTKFHELLFKPGTWVFDSTIDNITTLYPLELFYDAAMRVFIWGIVAALVLAGIGFAVLVSTKHFYKRPGK